MVECGEPDLEHRVFIGLGSNLGDRRANILEALRLLHSMPGVTVLRVSSLYRSEPWGVTDQPDFLNLVAEVATSRNPREMLDACREVERRMGRVRERRWGPRNIDVDILLFDELKFEEEDLIIPHPRMWERDFVVVPLRELMTGEGGWGEGGEGESRTGKVTKVGVVKKEEWDG